MTRHTYIHCHTIHVCSMYLHTRSLPSTHMDVHAFIGTLRHFQFTGSRIHTLFTQLHIFTLSHTHIHADPSDVYVPTRAFSCSCLHAHTEVQTHRPRSPCFGVTQPPLPGPEQQPSALSGAHTLPSWLGGSQTGRRATTQIWLGPPGTRAGRCPGSPAWGERGALPCPSSQPRGQLDQVLSGQEVIPKESAGASGQA